MSIVVGSNTLGSYPPTLSNATAFYKYEPFSFSFTGGSNFTASGSLVAFCSGVGTSNLVFSATNGTQSVGSSAGDTLTVGCTIGSVPVSVSYTLFLNAGRFVLNPSSTVVTFYSGEVLTVAFTSQSNITSTYTSPSLPPGIVFGTSNALPTSNWVLTTGTSGPTTTSANSNYTFFGSNAVTGNAVFTNLSIQVAGERLTMTPATSSNTLTIGTPVTSVVFSNDHYPVNAVSGGVTFGKPALPAGLSYYTTAGPLLLGGTAYPLGTGIYVSGTPEVTTNIPSSNVSVTITTSAAGSSALLASSVLTFTYSPTVLFTSPPLPTTSNTTYVLYRGVPLITTLVSNIVLSATTQFSPYVDPILSYTATGLPDGLLLSNVGTTAYIYGTPTTICSSNVVLTATSATGLVGSNTITINIRQSTLTITPNTTATQVFTVARSLANPNSSYTYPITFTLTNPAYPSTATNWISNSSLSVSNGFSYGLTTGTTDYTATLFGTPQVSAVTSGSTMTFSAQTIDGAYGSSTLNYVVSNDTFYFTTTTPVPFVFAQNQAINPVQFFVTTFSETPVTYFTPSTLSPLPAGLNITSTGQLQGTPLAASSGWISVNAANGYATGSPTATQFPYVILADTLHITSTTAQVPLSYSANSIPLYTTTASGLVPQTLVAKNYLYGLALASPSAPFVLTGPVSTSVAIPLSTRVTFTSSNTIGGLTSSASVQLEIVGGNLPTVNRYTVRGTSSGYGVYTSSNLFAFSNLYSGSASTLFDIQTDGSGTYLVADGSPTVRTITGTTSLVTGANIQQLAFLSNTWYAMGTSAGTVLIYYSISLSPLTWATVFATPDNPPTPRSLDTGRVMRTTSTAILLGGGSGITYGLPGSDQYVYSDCTLSDVNEISTTGPLIIAAGTGGLQYSTNGGSNWFATTGTALAVATSVVYGGTVSPIWMAIGSAASGSNLVNYSTNGVTWSNALSFPSTTRIGPIQFAGTNWSVFVNSNASPVLSATSDNSYVVYQHDILTTTMSDSTSWFTSNATFAITAPSSTTALYTFPVPLIVSNGTPTLTLLVDVTSVGGPTFISPTMTAYELYQYVPTSIAFDAGAGVSYFVDTATIPHGMTWVTNIPTGTANYYTALLSGSSVNLGRYVIDVYAQTSTGTSKVTITLSVSRLFPVTDHKTAAAYTAFTREKVIADAATSSVNNRVLPTAAGPFLLDTPPYETSAPVPCCLPPV